ncbi:hypothetical protein ACOSP7_011177 [Xanthoceras sorbifolium]
MRDLKLIMKFIFLELLYFSSNYTAAFKCFCFLVIFRFLFAAQALVKLPENATVPVVSTFGDSILDTGNNDGSFWEGKPRGRYGNSKIPSDFIVEQFEIKQLLPAYLDPDLHTNDLLTGVNFASSGAGYDPLTSKLVSAISISDQLEMFKIYIKEVRKLVGEKRIINITANSPFIVAASSDDIANTYFLIHTGIFQYNVSANTDLLVNSASNFLQQLYGLGARRIGVLGTPRLIGCLPSQRTLGGGEERKCAATYNQAAQLFNSKLSELIKNLNNRLPKGRMFYLDVYSPLNDMIQNPKKYGTGKFEVGFMCNQWSPFTCTNVSKYVFWDSFYPTEVAYKVIVNRVLRDFINQIFY